jgi:hypothetical protein
MTFLDDMLSIEILSDNIEYIIEYDVTPSIVTDSRLKSPFQVKGAA